MSKDPNPNLDLDYGIMCELGTNIQRKNLGLTLLGLVRGTQRQYRGRSVETKIQATHLSFG